MCIVKISFALYFFYCIQDSGSDKLYFFTAVCLIVLIKIHSYGNDGAALIVNQLYGFFPLSPGIDFLRGNGWGNPDNVQGITIFFVAEKMVCFLTESVYSSR